MLIDRKNVRAFVGRDAEQRAERCGHFLKALVGVSASRDWMVARGIAIEKAAGEGVNTVGGFLVPEDFDNAVVAIRELVGAFRSGCGCRAAKSGNQVRPRRTGGVTANWVAENAKIPESSFTLDALDASAKKLAILARGSAELFEDSAPDLAEFLAIEIAYAFAATEDDAAFNGDGTSTYAGITGLANKCTSGFKSAVAAASAHNTFIAIDTTDIANLVGAVMGAAIAGARWFVHPKAFACFARLSAIGGGLVTRLGPNGELIANYLGFPIEFSAKLLDGSSSMIGKPMIYFGDLSMSSVLVEARPMAVAASYQTALDADQVLIRGTERMDIINHSTGDAATNAPIAALLGTA